METTAGVQRQSGFICSAADNFSAHTKSSLALTHALTRTHARTHPHARTHARTPTHTHMHTLHDAKVRRERERGIDSDSSLRRVERERERERQTDRQTEIQMVYYSQA